MRPHGPIKLPASFEAWRVLGLGDWGLGFRVSGLGFRLWGLGVCKLDLGVRDDLAGDL